MYAAAGGASIANRRKQKQLQLNRRCAEGAASRIKSAPASRANKFARPHVLPPPSARPHPQPSPSPPQPPPPPLLLPPRQPQSSSAFHTSIDRRRRVEQHQDFPPVSSVQFPISPPPLSLESPASLTRPAKSNNFSFSPSSILDFRISSTSDLQCGGQGPGKAAWQGCSRPSPLPLSPISPHDCRGDGYKTKQCEAHRRWMKRNRIRDASYCYGSSGEDDEDERHGSLHRQRGEVSAAVNTVLYAGLGTTALGLVISFVGTGEKGFLSPELKLVGPSLLCAGLLCCLFRVLLCLCLCRCGQCHFRFCRRPSSERKEKKPPRKPDARPPGGRPLPTTTLLSPMQQQQQQQPAASSGPVSLVTKGRELLLSPAQLPE